jgi:hypothetical protein
MRLKRIALEHFEALNGGPLSTGDRLRLELLDALLDSALWFLDIARRASEAGLHRVAERYREAARSTVDELAKLGDPQSELLHARARSPVVRPFPARNGSEIFGDQG